MQDLLDDFRATLAAESVRLMAMSDAAAGMAPATAVSFALKWPMTSFSRATIRMRG
jgi:hypothetical protein